MDHEDQQPEVRELSSRQRRVLGVLMEKGLTTPEYYPMTLKALIAGCNQKSNRSPITNYDEDAVEDTIEQLRELGLAAVILPDSGRTERFRHYVRKRYSFSEPQIAILTELLLRGRQTLGELRGRASRMVPIEDLSTLRAELAGLMEQGYVQASGALERRGVEVDHGFYQPSENRTLTAAAPGPTAAPKAASPAPTPAAPQPAPAEALDDSLANELRAENRQLQSEVEELRQQVEELKDRLDDLCRSLGV
ncbi:MAG: DUF480 domain-containing protein [Planctomycetes bacterium]|nr:DUF480 domain-containing protein [Planctomycetota bacterium]